MKHEIYTWLEDINIAIIQIYDFLPVDIKYSDFEGDIKTQIAIERNIEIIGEALNRILNSLLTLPFLIRERLLIQETG